MTPRDVEARVVGPVKGGAGFKFGAGLGHIEGFVRLRICTAAVLAVWGYSDLDCSILVVCCCNEDGVAINRELNFPLGTPRMSSIGVHVHGLIRPKHSI